jgi:hypothetical protein
MPVAIQTNRITILGVEAIDEAISEPAAAEAIAEADATIITTTIED